MKHIALIAALSSVLLAACAQSPRKPGPNPELPMVTTDGKTISIDQEVLVFDANGAPVKVTWSLPAGGAWRFVPSRGLVIEGRLTEELLRGPVNAVVLDTKQDEITGCAADESRLRWTCTNKRTRYGIYKYTLRITDGKTDITRDPVIANW